MRNVPLSVLAAPVISPELHAAPPLAPGQIVVVGFPYPDLPPGACADRLCTVDAALTTLVPISAPLPVDPRSVLDIAIENPSSIVVLTGVPDPDPPDPEFGQLIGTVFHVDVATGAVTELATGFAMPGFPRPDENIATAPGGRIFVTGIAGILEVDRVSGTASVLVPGTFRGLDTENGRTSLVTAENCDPFLFCLFTFVRIDLATGAKTELGTTNERVTEIDVRPSGDLLVFCRGCNNEDGSTYVWSPGEPIFVLASGETWQAFTRGIASDFDGNALLAADGRIDPFGFDELELTRFSATGSYEVLAEMDADVGLSAIDVTPAFTRCSNGVDDDGDGAVDYPDDPDCRRPLSLSESPTSGGCGLGAELVFVLALLRRLRA
jgi:hypothetical protein